MESLLQPVVEIIYGFNIISAFIYMANHGAIFVSIPITEINVEFLVCVFPCFVFEVLVMKPMASHMLVKLFKSVTNLLLNYNPSPQIEFLCIYQQEGKKKDSCINDKVLFNMPQKIRFN